VQPAVAALPLSARQQSSLTLPAGSLAPGAAYALLVAVRDVGTATVRATLRFSLRTLPGVINAVVAFGNRTLSVASPMVRFAQ
jgi:hypothetical protein